jgi:hypothetical protein
MNYRKLFAAAALTASLVASPAVYAATTVHAPANAMFAKSKMVKLTLVNDSSTPIEVKAGDDVIKLEAGKPVTVNLPAGTRVVTNTTTPAHQAGSLIAQVDPALNGAILHIK